MRTRRQLQCRCGRMTNFTARPTRKQRPRRGSATGRCTFRTSSQREISPSSASTMAAVRGASCRFHYHHAHQTHRELHVLRTRTVSMDSDACDLICSFIRASCLALEQPLCVARAPRHRQTSHLAACNLAEEFTDARTAHVPVSHSAAPVAAGASDTYTLVSGKVSLQLPRPPPLPEGWANRREMEIVYESLEQRLFLNEEFLKNKARGRAACTDAAQLLSELNALGPVLTEQQVSSHMSMLARRRNSDNQSVLRITETLREQVGADAGGDAVEGEVDEGVEVGEVMQRVQEAAEELMNKRNPRQSSIMVGDGYASDNTSDGESFSDVGSELCEDGD